MMASVTQDLALRTKGLKILAFIALLAISYLLYPQITQFFSTAAKPSGGDPNPAITTEEQKNFANAEVFAQSLRYLTKNYYDSDSLSPPTLLKEALYGVSRNVPEVVVEFSNRGNRFSMEIAGKKKRFSVPTLKNPMDILPVVQEAFAFIAANYHGENKLEDIEYVSVNSMLRTLDPHSALLPPKVFNEFKTQTEGEFGGIGIVIGMKDGDLTVISPLSNTPAGRAGLRPKDKIVQIGEEATINMTLTEAVERLRGKVGTKVSLVLEREGAPAPIEVTLTRAKIKIESVQAKLVKDPKGDVGILKVKSFQEETLGEMKRHLRKMKEESANFQGLVLDMRNNPGGLLNQAIDIADMFLSEGTIVLTVGAQNQVLEINRAHSSDADENYPIVVLVNEGSASASEIVAGAIKNNNRGVILGKQTFGKGSVQSVYALRGGAALKITVAQYLTPGKASIQSVGITPDIKMLPVRVEEKNVDLIESETFREKDLDKHLESSLTKFDKPVFTVEYYQPNKEEDEFASQYTSEIDVDNDFELKFAKHLLLDFPFSQRKDILRQGKVLVDLTEQEESHKVAQALQKIGIDWSNSPETKGKPVAAVTFDVHSTGGQVLKAGEEVQLELKVRNAGKAPFHRLIATTESDYILLKNREFIFGKVAPGETKSWKVPIKVPASALSREDKITFKFQEGNGYVPEPFQSIVRTEPVKRPSYAYRMEVLDNGKQGSHGDGDKIVEVGEKITLKLSVTNQGDGKSTKTIVNLRNLDGQGIFLNEGRVKLNELNPQEEKVALLSFTVGPKFDKDQVELELLIQDNESQELLRDKLVFPVGKESLASKILGVQAGPLITLEKRPYPTKTKNNRISISGKVADPSGLKDVSVFVGENKAYLKTFENNGQEKPVNESSFVAAVDLEEEENNLITILARDKNNLTTRQSFYIYKE